MMFALPTRLDLFVEYELMLVVVGGSWLVVGGVNKTTVAKEEVS